MKLSIPRDQLLNPVPPRVFLCNTNKKVIGELPATNRHLNGKWNSYSEFSFDIQRTYIDMLTGETKVHPLYDKVEVPRNILVENVSYFALQDIDDTSGDNDVKSISAFSLEYTTSNKYLTNWYINTGEVDSKEVLYNESVYGIDYHTDTDSFYQLASGSFSPYESYYQQVYANTNQYTYEQVQVNDAQDYSEKISKNNDLDAQPHEKLYVKKFANVQFYNPNKEGLSLLHLIFENIPEWKIGNVDQSLWRRERKFSEDRISVYDFIQNNIHDTFGCAAVWDSVTGRVHFYEELEDDADEQNDTNTRFETDVFISKDNLASECKVSYSSDNIKTKLVVTGSEDLNIREVNLGRNEIMDLSFYHNLDWMEPDLYDAYNQYLDRLQEAETGLDKYGLPSTKFPMSYPDAMKGWVAANNYYTDMTNAVPAEGNVVLVGDEFKKLYCTFSPINTAYCRTTIGSGTQFVETSALYLDEAFSKLIPTPTDSEMYVVQGALLIYSRTDGKFKVDIAWDTKKFALIKKLNQYHVDEDTNANKQDNILLKLKNSASDVATIRIYDKRFEASTYDERLQYYTKDKNGKYSENDITFKNASDFNTKKTEFAKDGTTIWANDYYVQSVVVRASSGVSEEPDEYSIVNWIKSELTAEKMVLEGYKITYIGTMGAYFVLAKDETIPDNLQDYGVRLLEEKHKTYTTIFQTQTEAMLSQEKAQCIVQDDEPIGDYHIGTRWLDTNSNPVKLMEYQQIANAKSWVVISEEVSAANRAEYENYQRYIDNYEKLQTVQQVLTEKKRLAEYSRYGHEVSDISINPSALNGYSLMEVMQKVAEKHFNGHTIVMISINTALPLYTFTTSFDPIVYGENSKPYNYFEQYYVRQNYTPVSIDDETEFDEYDGTTETKTLHVAISENPTVYEKASKTYSSSTKYYVKNQIPNAYAPVEIDEDVFNKYDNTTDEKTLYVVTSGHKYVVYLNGNTPYVAYETSQGVYDMIMNYIRDNTEMNKIFTANQWIRLSPFIKEDEFNDSNFFLTEYDSEEEKQRIMKELMDTASKELKTLCKPSLEFSMTMANILALPEFESLFDQFQLGNFIKVGIRDGYVKRSRLLEVNMGFDDLSDFSCSFGNLVTTKSEIDKHADLLKTAVTAGKQVAKSSGSWQRAVDKANKLEEDIANGLKDAAIAIGSASGQAISWDSTGMHFRKYKDGSTIEFEPEEMAIINNALVATNDSWQTSKSSFGKYYVNGEERWGPIAEYITAQTIEGKFISGGSIEIGEGDTKFIVNPDGRVEIRSGGTNYVDAMKTIDNAYRFQVILEYTGLTVFSDTEKDFCKIVCKVYDNNKTTDRDITSQVIANGGIFTWKRTFSDDSEWTPTLVDGKPNIILIKHGDVNRNDQFSCSVNFDETKFNTEGGAS